MTNIKVDFSKITGAIRPLHGMNNCDRGALWGDLSDEFKALEVPIVRLHDTGGAYGGSHYVDIPNIFPNFDADPDDPASYDFTLTDYYLKYLVATGCEVMYRLGVTIEAAPKKYHIYPPADFHKWADICEHIVRHYNEGWADGFHFGIKYWEIWNEPDGIDPNITPFGPPMWLGTAEQYFEMYSITANHLKKMHPDIRVGGYSSCRVRGTFRDGKWIDGVTDYVESFFDYITDPKTRAPLDFFTWHTYLGHDFYRLIEEAKFARDILDRYGFTEAENFNTEWNHYLSADKVERMELMPTERGASHYVATMCDMQKSGFIDKAMFYQAQRGSTYNPLFTIPGHRKTKAYHGFRLFSELYKLRRECSSDCDNSEVYYAAAIGDDRCGVLISNPNDCTEEARLDFCGAELENITVSLVDAEHDGDAVSVTALDGLTLPPYSVTLIIAKKAK